MSLNFRDCHAKIRQVDSQSTIDKAVVVQVRSASSVCHIFKCLTAYSCCYHCGNM